MSGSENQQLSSGQAERSFSCLCKAKSYLYRKLYDCKDILQEQENTKQLFALVLETFVQKPWLIPLNSGKSTYIDH